MGTVQDGDEGDRQSVRIPPATNPSTPELVRAVRLYMSQAERILAHPLAGVDATFTVKVEVDPATGASEPYDVELSNVPAESWEYLATLVRTVIFLESEPTSLKKLTGRMEREHPPLRGSLKPIRSEFERWKRQVFFGVTISVNEVSPPTGLLTPQGQTRRVTGFQTGEAYALTSDAMPEGMVADWELANTYLNTRLWHADAEKYARYEDYSPTVWEVLAKAAELRTLQSVQYVRWLTKYIRHARMNGYDF